MMAASFSDGGQMLSKFMFRRVRELKKDGKSNSEIARMLNVNRKTVSKYLDSNTPPQYSQRTTRTKDDPFSSYESRVKALLDQDDDLFSSEIFEVILSEGYKGSERTLRRRISDLKAVIPKERFFMQKYSPGEQSQYDFKEKFQLPFIDGIRAIHLHFSTLPFSDKFFIKSYPRKNFECFIDGIHSFFEHIGGMTDKVRIDNLSPCVSKVHKGRRRTYTKFFQEAIDYYHFEVLPCAPAKGSDKGDVERDIRTHARRIQKLINIEGTVFKDFKELNSWLLNYVNRKTTDKIQQKFDVEKQHLNVVPPRDENILCRVEELRATAYGTVLVGDYFFSVPDNAIKSKCKIIAGPYTVKIYRNINGPKLIAEHPRKDGDSILLEHILPSLVRKPQAMIRWAHKDVLFPNDVFRKFYKKCKQIVPEFSENEFLRAINLIQYVTLAELTVGIELIMQEQCISPYEELSKLLLVGHKPGNVINISEELQQKKLSPNLEEFDELIPTGG